MANPAVFLDRDGTLIEEVGYATRPEQIRILGGVARALTDLAEAGYKLIVVTNQSGIARGLATEENLERFHQALDDGLGLLGARLDAYYACPHHPDPGDTPRPNLAVECDCRKPKPGLILRAAEDFDIDLSASWTVGDTWRDVAAGQAAGVQTIKLPADPEHDFARPPDVNPPTAEADTLAEAARIILGCADAETDVVNEVPETTEEQAEEPPDEAMEEPSDEGISEPAGTEESAQVEDAAPSQEKIQMVQETEVSEDAETMDVLEEPPAEESSEEPEPETSEGHAAMPSEDAATSATVAGHCARCGRDVSESALADGVAGERDGFLLCADCLARQPREEAGPLPGDATGLLRSILAELRRMRRTQRMSNLTFLRLMAYIIQAAALFCGLVLALASDDKVRFIQIAIFLQLLVLTLLVLERKS